MTQLWAIVARSGKFELRYTDSADVRPENAGHRAECRNRAVWPLDREPIARLGEIVCYETGEVVFDQARAVEIIVPEIKAETERAILLVAPFWRQINDLAEPTALGAEERRNAVSALRARSNDLEAIAAKAETTADIEKIWAALAEMGV